MPEKDLVIPDDDDLELKVLSIAYRALNSRGDRNRIEAVKGESQDPITGLINSEAGLVPEAQALRGRDYVVSAWHDPGHLALAFLRRDDGTQFSEVRGLRISWEKPNPLTPGVPQGGQEDKVWGLFDREAAEKEIAYMAKQPECKGWRIWVREVRGKDALTSQELRGVDELTSRFNRIFHRMAERGWLILKPPVPFEPAGPENLPAGTDPAKYRVGVDDKRRVFAAHFSDEGIDAAIEACRDHPIYSQVGPFSSLEVAMPDVKAAAGASNPFQHRRLLDEQAGRL